MQPPPSKPSDTLYDPSASNAATITATNTAKTGQSAGEATVEPGTTFNQHKVATLPPGTIKNLMPGTRDQKPVHTGKLPANIQSAAPGNRMVTDGQGAGTEQIREALSELLAVDQPLDKSLKKREEYRYVLATELALAELKKTLENSGDNSKKDTIAAVQKAHKHIIQELNRQSYPVDLKVTFNLPSGQRVQLMPPELDDLADLSDLDLWIKKSQTLTSELKLQKFSDYDQVAIEQEILSGKQEFERLISQLDKQEALGFQNLFQSILNPNIEINCDGRSLQQSMEQFMEQPAGQSVEQGDVSAADSKLKIRRTDENDSAQKPIVDTEQNQPTISPEETAREKRAEQAKSTTLASIEQQSSDSPEHSLEHSYGSQMMAQLQPLQEALKYALTGKPEYVIKESSLSQGISAQRPDMDLQPDPASDPVDNGYQDGSNPGFQPVALGQWQEKATPSEKKSSQKRVHWAEKVEVKEFQSYPTAAEPAAEESTAEESTAEKPTAEKPTPPATPGADANFEQFLKNLKDDPDDLP